MPSGSSHALKFAWCCSARSSVRRHDRRLAARRGRTQYGKRGDDGLARTDVALQQAVHRRGPVEILADLLPGAVLAGRQLERQALQKAGDALDCTDRGPRHAQAARSAAVLRRLRRCARSSSSAMRRWQGCRPASSSAVSAPAGGRCRNSIASLIDGHSSGSRPGQVIHERLVGEYRQRLPGERPQSLLVQPFGRRIDRGQGWLGRRRVGVHGCGTRDGSSRAPSARRALRRSIGAALPGSASSCWPREK